MQVVKGFLFVAVTSPTLSGFFTGQGVGSQKGNPASALTCRDALLTRSFLRLSEDNGSNDFCQLASGFSGLQAETDVVDCR